jgi:hypothetical protein
MTIPFSEASEPEVGGQQTQHLSFYVMPGQCRFTGIESREVAYIKINNFSRRDLNNFNDSTH